MTDNLHQVQPNRWSCLPTAFAIAADIPVNELITRIGHDGSFILFPLLEEPYRRRAFHVIEVTSALLPMDVFCTPVFPHLALHNRKSGDVFEISVDLNFYLQRYSGVLIGKFFGNAHAVAYLNDWVYDPNGSTYRLDGEMIIESFWIVK